MPRRNRATTTAATSPKGNDLIAKLMASGEGLQFTRVSVGDGSIPSGSSPDSMTDLGHRQVMDGMIASIANSNNGEVSIVAQVSSVGVETGFNATELGLWATDPDEGEILYTYLSLQEHPEWIRPDGDAVNKLAGDLHARYHCLERQHRHRHHQGT